MPGLIRAGAVGPAAKQAKSGGAGVSPAVVAQVRTAHLYHAQARRLCHQILHNFSRQFFMGLSAHP